MIVPVRFDEGSVPLNDRGDDDEGVEASDLDDENDDDDDDDDDDSSAIDIEQGGDRATSLRGHGRARPSMRDAIANKGLMKSMADILKEQNQGNTTAGQAPHKANFQDYLKAQRQMKMQRFAGSIKLNVAADLNLNPDESAKTKNRRNTMKEYIALVGQRQGSTMEMQSFLQQEAQAAATADADVDEDGELKAEEYEDNSHPHNIPWYSAPIQRQRWADAQVLPHINWGDLFFDLFYVAAAYNMGSVLIDSMNPNNWLRGVVYFIGIFGPLYNTWENDLLYSSRYTLVDYSHRLFEVVRFFFVSFAVLHIKPLKFLSDNKSIETFALCLAFSCESVMHIFLNLEALWYAEGDRKAIVNMTKASLLHQHIPMTLAYITATTIAAVHFFPSVGNKDDGYDDPSGGYGDDSYGDSAYGNSSYGEDSGYETNYTYGYNGTGTGTGTGTSTGYEDGYTRFLAADADGMNWTIADLPLALCCMAYILNIIYGSIRQIIMANDSTKNLQDYFVPNNIDYMIHRYGEWVMLMIGESILSLLIVDTTESSEYYTIEALGVLTVILIQNLKFESEPSHSDGHALWRKVVAGMTYGILIQVLSMGLIAFGVSYKVMLKIILKASSKPAGYEDAYRLLLEKFDGRKLAEMAAVTEEAAAALFCASLTIVLVSLELMMTTHRGARKNFKILFKNYGQENSSVNWPLVFIGVFKLGIIIITATLPQMVTDMTSLAIYGFVAVFAMAFSRIVGWGLVHKESEIKRVLAQVKLSTVTAKRAAVGKLSKASRAAGRGVHRRVKRLKSAIDSSSHMSSSVVTDEGGSMTGSIRGAIKTVWDASFDSIIVTDKEGIIKHVNSTALEEFGHDHLDELVGQNIKILVGGGEAKYHQTYLDKFNGSNRTKTSIGKQRALHARRKDGSEFPCIIGIKTMPNNSDMLVGYIRNMDDITGMPENNEDANTSPSERKYVDDTSFDAIIVTDYEGIIKQVNLTTLTEFGYTEKEELEGHNISMLVGGGDAKRHHRFLKNFHKRKKENSTIGTQRILKSRRKDGSEFPCVIGIRKIPETELLIGYIRNMSGLTDDQRSVEIDSMSRMSKSVVSNEAENILDDSFDAIVVTDFVGKIIRVNQTALDIFGYGSRDELEGKNIKMLVGGGEADHHDDYLANFKEQKRTASTIGKQRVLYSKRKDGTEFACIIGIKRNDKKQHLVGYIRDMSDFARQDSSVEITNINLLSPADRLVDDTSFDAIIVTDYEGVIQKVNSTVLKEFGYASKADLVGQNISMLVGGGQHSKHDNYLKKFQTSGKESSTIGNQRVLFSKRKDGSEFPCIIGIKKVPATELLVGYIRNMTGISGVERQASVSKMNLKNSIDEGSFDAIIVIDFKGVIQDINQTTVEEFRYDSKAALIGNNIAMLVGGGHADNHHEYLARFMESGRSDTTIGNTRILYSRRKDGTEFPCLIGIKKMPNSDFLIGYLRNMTGVVDGKDDGEYKLSEADETSFDAIIVIDMQGIIQEVNKTTVTELGYVSKEDLVGNNISMLVGGDHADMHDSYLANFKATGKSESTIGKQRVLFARRKDGSEFPSIIGIKKIPGTEFLIGYLRNMTGIVDGKDDGKYKLSEADETSFDAIIVIDMQGIIQEVNKTTVTEFGYVSKDGLIGKNISMLVGGDHSHKHDNYLAKFKATGKSESTIGKQRVLHAMRKDESEFPCIVGIKKIPGTLFLIGYLRNMTGIVDQKEEKLLSRTEEVAFNSIIVTDFDGIVKEVNQTVLSEFGYASKEELIGKNISILVGGNDGKSHDKYLERFKKAGKTGSTIGKQRVLRARKKDGKEFQCQIGIQKIPGTEYLIGYITNLSKFDQNELESVGTRSVDSNKF